MNSYRDLTVWQKACDLVLLVYELTKEFPSSEQFGLTSQMRRSAVSIPSNIAEGFTRRSPADHSNFARIAFASGAELETQLYLAEKLKLSNTTKIDKVKKLLDEVMRMLNKLTNVLKSNK